MLINSNSFCNPPINFVKISTVIGIDDHSDGEQACV
jgi:hypothetical protein